MKEKLKKVLALFLIICCHATISHADMVSSDPFTNYLPVLIFVCIAVIMYSFGYYIIVFNKFFDGVDRKTLVSSPISFFCY